MFYIKTVNQPLINWTVSVGSFFFKLAKVELLSILENIFVL